MAETLQVHANVPIATPTLPAITTAITKENATAEYVRLRTDIQSL